MKKFLSGVLAFTIIFGGMTYNPVCENVIINANAIETGTYENLSYEKYDDYVEIIGCDLSATEVIIPSEIEGLPVTIIGNSAFEFCTTLSSVTIPDSVTKINAHAFGQCYSLMEITIPKSVTEIGEDVFSGSVNLTDITVDSANVNYASIDGVLFNKELTELITYPCGKDETEYIIPDGVTSIRHWAFGECVKLTSVTIPDSVTNIGDYAFSGCYDLAEITIPNSVTSIGYWAFMYCSSLTEIIIPDSVVSIYAGAFCDCDGLIEVTIPDSVIEIGERAFSICDGLTDIKVDSGNANYTSVDGVLFNKELTELLEYPCGKSETEYIIPDGVTSIAEAAFYGCTNLTKVAIPESVTSIGIDAFLECSNLIEAAIPNGVTDIGDFAFSHCSSLKEIIIPETLTEIKYDVFSGCSNLTEVIIPENVTSINSSFSFCDNLKKVTILNPECEIYDSEYTFCNGSDENWNIYYAGTIYGYANSTAQAYADTYGYNFVALDSETTAVEIVYGDANCDGIANISDVVAVSAFVSNAKTNTLSEQGIKNADVKGNNDGISADDAFVIQQYATGVIKSLPIISE